APGDRIWVKADLPDSQSARYLLVLAFLRGSTNPPPVAWFHRCDTWTRECAAHGMTVTVPRGAQQVLLFLAPKTGGDFRTLVGPSLAIKVDSKCLDRIPELQAPCLMEGRDSLILTDGHSTSIVEALTAGPEADLAMEASYTPQLRYGYYSPYIASVLDIARILGSFDTAQYQYIPALATQRDDHIALTLNTP